MAGNTKNISTNSSFFDLANITRLVAKSESLHSSCLLLADHMKQADMKLLSVAFCDLKNENPTIRAYRDYPEALVNLSNRLTRVHGCPLVNEALRLRHPFDAIQLDKRDQPTFLSRRYLEELNKLGHHSITVVPITLGRGLAVFSVGLNQNELNNKLRSAIIETICQISISIIGRFPEVTRMFEMRYLSPFEAKALLLCSNGFSNSEIADVLNLGEQSVQMVFERISAKLSTRNQAHAVSRAVAMGEISNLQLGPHELIWFPE